MGRGCSRAYQNRWTIVAGRPASEAWPASAKTLRGEDHDAGDHRASSLYEELKASIPAARACGDARHSRGVRAQEVKKLYDELGVDSIRALEARVQAKVASLDGFGEKSQLKILKRSPSPPVRLAAPAGGRPLQARNRSSKRCGGIRT